MKQSNIRATGLKVAAFLSTMPIADAAWYQKCELFTGDAGQHNNCVRTESLCTGDCTLITYSVSPAGNCVAASFISSCTASGPAISVKSIFTAECITTGGYYSGYGCDCDTNWVPVDTISKVYNCAK